MRDLAERGLDAAVGAGASYADCRVVARTVEVVEVRNGRLVGVTHAEDAGVGSRVLVDGAWGFAGVDRVEGRRIEEAALLAVRIARASARQARARVRLAPCDAVVDSYATPVAIDPFSVPAERRVDVPGRGREARPAGA